MKYAFHPDAVQELNDAIDYYNACQDDLGCDFADEVYRSIQHILKFPKAWSALSPNTRRCLTNRFPFGIIYQIKEKQILILALMQLNRKPTYWQARK